LATRETAKPQLDVLDAREEKVGTIRKLYGGTGEIAA
jgi:hypothetical protein